MTLLVGSGGFKGHKNCEQTFCEQTGVSYGCFFFDYAGVECKRPSTSGAVSL